MLLHEVIKHCRFPRLQYLGQRSIRDSKSIPYYKLDWSVFESDLPLPNHPAFQEEFKYCQYLLKQRDKNELECKLAHIVYSAVKDKISASIDFETTLITGFADMIARLCDCAYDLSVNFYYRNGRRNLLNFLLIWWILQENFRANIVIQHVKLWNNILLKDIEDIKSIISQLQAEATERTLYVELLDILKEATKAFGKYCERFTALEEDEGVEFSD